MKRIARTIVWAALIALAALFFGNVLDNALQQQAYKTCKQLPKHLEEAKDCERFNNTTNTGRNE